MVTLDHWVSVNQHSGTTTNKASHTVTREPKNADLSPILTNPQFTRSNKLHFGGKGSVI